MSARGRLSRLRWDNAVHNQGSVVQRRHRVVMERLLHRHLWMRRMMSDSKVPERQAGLGLLEAVVAWALALVVILGVLGLVCSFRRSYARTEARLDASERARLAIDTISKDLRLAGLGVDPDGAPDRPDEALEGAWAGAVVLRGDLDASDPAARNDPEPWIAGVYPSVLTGNDEIVAYALRKESGSGGSDAIFEADVSSPVTIVTPSGDRVAPRDGIVETVRLPHVVAASGGSCGSGCILYRATLTNNASLWGTGNALVWQPVVDGVSTLAFRYFDESGNEVAAPGGAETLRLARGRIASVEVRIVALESRADPLWSDPADPDPTTRSYRKAELVARLGLENARRTSRVG